MLQPDIGRLRDGDSGMWNVAFHFLWPIAYRQARRRLIDYPHQDSEDIAIVSIGEVAERVHSVRGFPELEALCATIAARRAVDLLRHRRAARRSAAVTESLDAPELPEASASSKSAQPEDVVRLLGNLVETLGAADALLIRLYYCEGFTQSEIAQRLMIPVGTIGVQLTRAIRKLRGILEGLPDLLNELRERNRYP